VEKLGFVDMLLTHVTHHGWQVSAKSGLNHGLNRSGRNRFLPVSAKVTLLLLKNYTIF